MGISREPREERRGALMKLQRLLAQAEASLSTDGKRMDPVFEDLGQAFEDFRSRYHDREEDVPASRTPAAEARRMAVRILATAIAEMDESVSQRDSERIRAALDDAKQAIDTCQRIDQSASSGLRMRTPVNPDQIVPIKGSRER